MSVRVTEIEGLDPDAPNPVIVPNFNKYWWQLFGAKGFRARDQAYRSDEPDGANVAFLVGEKQMYRGYIDDVDTAGSTRVAPTSAPKEQLRTYVAKCNRASGDMRLVEVNSCLLSHVAHDRCTDRTSSNQQLDSGQLKKLLVKFNSKSGEKRQKRVHSQSFDMDIMDAKLRQTVAEYVVPAEEASAAGMVAAAGGASSGEHEYAQLQTKILAKANPRATSLADLYLAKDLIGWYELDQLTGAALQLLRTPPEELSMANEYLNVRVKALMQSPDAVSERNQTLARVCLYMDVLVRLVHRKETRKRLASYGLSPFTTALDEPIRQQFLEQSGHSGQPMVTKFTQHKTLMYYLALAFVLEGTAHIPCELLHQSLQISKQKLIAFARAAGASYNPKLDRFYKGTVVESRSDPSMKSFEEGSGAKRYRRK